MQQQNTVSLWLSVVLCGRRFISFREFPKEFCHGVEDDRVESSHVSIPQTKNWSRAGVHAGKGRCVRCFADFASSSPSRPRSRSPPRRARARARRSTTIFAGASTQPTSSDTCSAPWVRCCTWPTPTPRRTLCRCRIAQLNLREQQQKQQQQQSRWQEEKMMRKVVRQEDREEGGVKVRMRMGRGGDRQKSKQRTVRVYDLG